MDTATIALLRRAYGLGEQDPAPLPVDVPPDDPGLLHTIGTILDIPANFVRTVLGGHPLEDAFHPFAKHTSGQDVNRNLLGVQQSDNLFSGPGLGGLATELLTDPLMYLGGLGGLGKIGKATELVGGHLAEAAARGAEFLGRIPEAERIGKTLLHPELGYKIVENGKLLDDAQIAAQLAQRPDAIGQAAKAVLEHNAANGIESLRLPENVGERIANKQADMLRLSGEVDPLGILRLPLIPFPGIAAKLPKIPLLTEALHYPEMRLWGGAGAAQGIADAGSAVGKALNPLTSLFRVAPGAPTYVEDALKAEQQARNVAVMQGAADAQAGGADVAAAMAGKAPHIGEEERAFQAARTTPPTAEQELMAEVERQRAAGTLPTDINGIPLYNEVRKSIDARKAGEREAQEIARNMQIAKQTARMDEEAAGIVDRPLIEQELKRQAAAYQETLEKQRAEAIKAQAAQMDVEAAGRNDANIILDTLKREAKERNTAIEAMQKTIDPDGNTFWKGFLRVPEVTELPKAPAIRSVPARSMEAEAQKAIYGPQEHLGPPQAPVSQLSAIPREVDARKSQLSGQLVGTDGTPILPDDIITVYHATTPESAEALSRGGFVLGGKPQRPRTQITDPIVAQMLRKNVGDFLDYEPGVGMGPGLYVGLEPKNLQAFGNTVVPVRVRAGDLIAPPERPRLSATGALLVGDGYLEKNLPPHAFGSVPHQAPVSPIKPIPGADIGFKSILEEEGVLGVRNPQGPELDRLFGTHETPSGEVVLNSQLPDDAAKQLYEAAQAKKPLAFNLEREATPELTDFERAAAHGREALAAGKAIGEHSPEAEAAINNALELGRTDVGKDLSPVVEHVRKSYDTWLEGEQLMGAPTKPLQTERRLGYQKHLPSQEGFELSKQWTRNPTKFVEDNLRLIAAAEAKGIDISELAEQSISVQRAERDSKTANMLAGLAPNKPTGVTDKQVKLFVSRLDPKYQQILNTSPALAGILSDSFREAGKLTGSQIPRMPLLSWGTIEEINTALGRKFFETDPAKLYAARMLDFKRVEAAFASAENVLLKTGKELLGDDVSWEPKAGMTSPVRIAGVNPLKDTGVSLWTTPDGEAFGVDAINKMRENKHLPPVVVKDLATAQAVAKSFETFLYPEKTNELLNWYDKITAVFKNYLTRAFPGFHLRNHMSNMLQSWFGGVPLNAEEGDIAMKVLGGREVAFQTPYGVLSRDQIKAMAERLGVTKGGYFENLLRDSIGSQGTWNPLNPYNRMLGTGERVSAGISIAPMALSSGVGSAALNASGRTIEDYARLRHFLYEIKQGKALDAAAASVNKYLFDYSKAALSPFERDVMNRAVFFYGYQRNVIPLVAETMIKNIEKISAVTRLGIQPGLPDRIPMYARGQLIVPRGEDEKGNPKLTYALGTPVESALGTLGTNPLTELNPIPRTALELLSGRDFFLRKDIKDARSAPHYADSLPQGVQDALGVTSTPMSNGETRLEMNPFIAYALRNNPLSRASNIVSRFSDERKGIGDSLLNLFAGPRTISVDEDIENKRAVKEAIKGKLDEEITKGGAYKFEEYAPTKSAEGQKAKALLKLLRLQSR